MNILKYQNPSGSIAAPNDTTNVDYLKFKETLPDNLRLTPEKDYHMYEYWRLNGQPENFDKGKNTMFWWDRSDKGWHAGSIAEDPETGIYHFMKPKHHSTVGYELDWFNKGLRTLEGGRQVPVRGKHKKFWEDFTSKYQLDTIGVDYRYVPVQKTGGIIKAQEGTNLFTPSPLSPVGIALNQARAMAKMKGEQQHLPPGVKEVVGPDGKKVFIRAEQPLQPMGQEVAAWLPGVGDVVEVGQVVNDVKNGNLGTAALAAGLMILPGNARKILDKFGVDLGDIKTFSKLSDQEWDNMYFEAIDSGDMDLVQQIRDAHFKVKATGASVDVNGNLIKTYRGQYPQQMYKERNLNPFSDARDSHGSSGYFSSTSSKIGDTYVKRNGDKFELYTNFTNPSVVDAKGKGYKTAVTQVEPDGRVVGIQTDDYVNKAFAQGHDGVIIKNVKDASVGNTLNDLEKIADDYVGKGGRSKLADPITREFDLFTWEDEIIPISRRDNFNVADIRYGFAPLILGLGAAKAVSNSNTKEQQ